MTFYFQEFREFSVFQDMFDSACRTFFALRLYTFNFRLKKLFMFFRSLVTIENHAVEKLHFGLIPLNKKLNPYWQTLKKSTIRYFHANFLFFSPKRKLNGVTRILIENGHKFRFLVAYWISLQCFRISLPRNRARQS